MTSFRRGHQQNSSELPTLFGSFLLEWVIKHLIYGTVYYINILTNLLLRCRACQTASPDSWLRHLCKSFLFDTLVQDATRIV
jgi:hypothetical protein